MDIQNRKDLEKFLKIWIEMKAEHSERLNLTGFKYEMNHLEGFKYSDLNAFLTKKKIAAAKLKYKKLL